MNEIDSEIDAGYSSVECISTTTKRTQSTANTTHTDCWYTEHCTKRSMGQCQSYIALRRFVHGTHL